VPALFGSAPHVVQLIAFVIDRRGNLREYRHRRNAAHCGIKGMPSSNVSEIVVLTALSFQQIFILDQPGWHRALML